MIFLLSKIISNSLLHLLLSLKVLLGVWDSLLSCFLVRKLIKNYVFGMILQIAKFDKIYKISLCIEKYHHEVVTKSLLIRILKLAITCHEFYFHINI